MRHGGAVQLGGFGVVLLHQVARVIERAQVVHAVGAALRDTLLVAEDDHPHHSAVGERGGEDARTVPGHEGGKGVAGLIEGDPRKLVRQIIGAWAVRGGGEADGIETGGGGAGGDRRNHGAPFSGMPGVLCFVRVTSNDLRVFGTSHSSG